LPIVTILGKYHDIATCDSKVHRTTSFGRVQYFREQELDPEWVDEQWEPVAGDESDGEEYIAVQADELEEWLERVMEREPLIQLRRLYTRRNGGAVSIGDVYKEQTDGTRELVARLMASGTFKWFELVDY